MTDVTDAPRLPRPAFDNAGLQAAIVAVQTNNNDPKRREDTELDDYADLGEADLPPRASVHMAAETGEPVGNFEPDFDEYPIPDHDDLEVEYE